METCKTFETPEAAAAFMLGFRLSASGANCSVRIDCEEPETVLVDLCELRAEGAWFVVLGKFKEELAEAME